MRQEREFVLFVAPLSNVPLSIDELDFSLQLTFSEKLMVSEVVNGLGAGVPRWPCDRELGIRAGEEKEEEGKAPGNKDGLWKTARDGGGAEWGQ